MMIMHVYDIISVLFLHFHSFLYGINKNEKFINLFSLTQVQFLTINICSLKPKSMLRVYDLFKKVFKYIIRFTKKKSEIDLCILKTFSNPLKVIFY